MKKAFKTSKAKRFPTLQPKLLTILLIGAIIVSESLGCFFRMPRASHEAIQVCFTPGGQCTLLVEEALAAAQNSVLVQAYYLTSDAIVNALIAAHNRGVSVKILVDRSQLKARASKVRPFLEEGISISIDAVPGIAHNKVMIIDDKCVITGSFNWTDAAENRNAENLLFIRDQGISRVYRDNWEERAEKAQVIELSDIENAAE
ncbi:MAG: phospholipase D family protein [Bacteroidota bacterium]